MITNIKVVKTANARQRPFLTMAGGSLKLHDYPIYSVILKHQTQGSILIDAGYGSHFLERLTPLPRRVYGHFFIDKTQPEETRPVLAGHIFDWVLLSHFHPDHMGGLSELRYRELRLSRELEKLQQKSRMGQLQKGFFKELLADVPPNWRYFEEEVACELGEEGLPGMRGFDLFGDQSLYAIPMSGHALGQHIFYLKTLQGPVMFGVDVAWHWETLREHRLPKGVTGLIVNDYRQMMADIELLAQVKHNRPELPILLSHCEKSLQELLTWDQGKGGKLVVYQES